MGEPSAASDSPSRYNVEDLVQKAQEFLAEIPPQEDLAQRFLERALELEPANPDVLDAYGELMSHLNETERAIMVLKKSVELAPAANPAKYMYLAQMLSGRQALEYAKVGVTMMEGEASRTPEMNQQLAAAYCHVVELYMTDLCDEPEAQEQCEKALQLARAADENNVEVLTSLATYKKTIGEVEEARMWIQQAVARIRSCGGDLDVLPTFEVRSNVSRVLLDLGLTEEALEILHALLDEDDEDFQVWHTLGCAHHFKKDRACGEECVERLRGLLANGDQDAAAELVEMVDDLERELSQLPEADDEAEPDDVDVSMD